MERIFGTFRYLHWGPCSGDDLSTGESYQIPKLHVRVSRSVGVFKICRFFEVSHDSDVLEFAEYNLLRRWKEVVNTKMFSARHCVMYQL